MKRIVLSAVMLVATCGAAFAQSGSMGMGGTLSASYQLIISQGTSGPTLGGTSTAASIGLGTILYYGTSSNATGVTQNNTGDTHGSDTGSIALSFPVKVEIDKANSSSANYTLNAALSAAAVSGTTVLIGSSTLTTTAADTMLTATGTYGSAVGYTVTLNVGTAVVQADAPLGQTINLSCTPN